MHTALLERAGCESMIRHPSRTIRWLHVSASNAQDVAETIHYIGHLDCLVMLLSWYLPVAFLQLSEADTDRVRDSLCPVFPTGSC